MKQSTRNEIERIAKKAVNEETRNWVLDADHFGVFKRKSPKVDTNWMYCRSCANTYCRDNSEASIVGCNDHVYRGRETPKKQKIEYLKNARVLFKNGKTGIVLGINGAKWLSDGEWHPTYSVRNCCGKSMTVQDTAIVKELHGVCPMGLR